MSVVYETSYRTTDDLREPSYMGLADPYGILALTEQKRRAFRNNPFLDVWNLYSQQVMHADGVAFACEFQYPLLLRTPIDTRVILGGSTTFVAKEYRKTGAGLAFGPNRNAKAPGMGSSGSSMSQMMVKVLRLLKVNLMEMPRYVCLFRSRSVIEMVMPKQLARLVSCCVDIPIHIYYKGLKCLESFRNREYDFRTITVDNTEALDAIATLIARDPHLFSEVHDVRWLHWMMTESFEGDPLSLTAIYKNDELVGFYMIKKRFYKKASGRGFRNVWLRSVMEWQTIESAAHQLPWFLLHAIISNRKGLDASEIGIDDAVVGRFLRCCGARKVGNGNYTYTPAADDPLRGDARTRDKSCWRLRPAMCDGGLN